MRIWIAGLSVALVASCSQNTEIAEAPEPSAAAVEAGLPALGTATDATRQANAALSERLDLAQGSDGDDARRNRLAYIKDEAILDADGNVVWAIPQFEFLEEEAPETVNPSLWRQSQLAAHHGLFQVADRIYQVRGYDLSVMSVIEGETGWIIVDPLTATETAAASLKLVNDTLGARPVTGVLYTHSHADHFGGARGVISDDEVAAGVPVLAPIGFSESAVSENLIAGNQMGRRATLMFGNTLPRSTTAHVGSGLGPGLPNGTISLILPTEEIEGRGTVRVIDGVTFEFIDAAGTEAPAEFMFYLPELQALCTAAVATATFHNVLTPRGAKVRDALKWSRAIDYVLAEYGARSDVVFASHHWPTWGQESVVEFLRSQRDIYRYVHDQTLRNANAGATMIEAAEAVEEPDFQAGDFATRGYYGTLNHNAKRLLLDTSALRDVVAMGVAGAVLVLGLQAFASGDYRWAAEVFNHLVFAEPENQEARDWLSAAYEQLGFQAESGAWRSYYLTGAAELRRGVPDIGNPQLGNADFLKAVPSLDLFDALAARFNPAKMKRDPFTVVFTFPDTGETVSLLVGTSVLVPRDGGTEDPTATVTIDRLDLDRLILGDARPLGLITSGKMRISGNRGAVSAMFDALDQPDFWFNTVTP